MYKKIVMGVCVVAQWLAMCLSPQPARAISLSYNNGAVQAIDDITLHDGNQYNITFVAPPADPANLSSLTPTFTDTISVSNSDLDSIYDILNGSGDSQQIYNSSTPGGPTDYFYVYEYIPYTTPDTTPIAEVFDITSVPTPTYDTFGNIASWSPAGQWHGYDYFDFDLDSTNTDYESYTFAKFTPYTSPVPEPTTVLLLGIGLICLAGMLRKSKRQIHIA